MTIRGVHWPIEDPYVCLALGVLYQAVHDLESSVAQRRWNAAAWLDGRSRRDPHGVMLQFWCDEAGVTVGGLRRALKV